MVTGCWNGGNPKNFRLTWLGGANLPCLFDFAETGLIKVSLRNVSIQQLRQRGLLDLPFVTTIIFQAAI